MTGVWAAWFSPLLRALHLAAEYQSEGNVKSVEMNRLSDAA